MQDIEYEHYENMSMKFTAIFQGSKNEKIDKKMIFFFIFAQNLDCGYTLDPPQ